VIEAGGGNVLSSALGRLRVVGAVEGVSFLLLLGVAMPLKYMAGRPEAVSVVGMAHGVLWMAYMATIIDVRRAVGWSLRQCAVAAVASVLPFGPFVLDTRLRQEMAVQTTR
jgi:integral membrane protein